VLAARYRFHQETSQPTDYGRHHMRGAFRHLESVGPSRDCVKVHGVLTDVRGATDGHANGARAHTAFVRLSFREIGNFNVIDGDVDGASKQRRPVDAP
jgi:hypothetical protein